MNSIIYPANSRGTKDLGWLLSKFSFSFSSYQNPINKSFGLLHTFNDDVVKPQGGFGLHPHVNMEIVSVLLQGTMNHKDSMGYSETVSTDCVQIMSARTGLRHEEYNVGNDDVHFLQIWIEPKLQNIAPRYQHRFFPKEQRINQLQTIVSNEEGTAHCWINQNTKLSLGYYTQATELTYSFNLTNKCVFVFVIAGSLQADGKTIAKRDAIGIWNTSNFMLSIEPNTEFIVIEVPINH